MRKLLATTAIVAIAATGAYAQTAPAPTQTPAATQAEPAQMVEPANGHLATSLIGENVYNGPGNDAQNIGDVNDIIIGPDGQVKSVVVGVGGFLGIGEKNVEVEYSTLKWAERSGDRWIVIETTADALKAQAAFDSAPYLPAPAVTISDNATPPATQAPADQTAQAPAATEQPAADAPADKTAEAPATEEKPADQTAQAPAATEQPATGAPADGATTAAIDKSTLKPLDVGSIKTEEFTGTTVYGAEDANVGEIGDVVMSQDGKVDAVLIDVGGFLGIGEKQVAVGMDNLAFMTDEDGNRYLYTSFTKEQLEAAPAYEEASYSEQRDQMRVTIPN